MNYKLPKGFVEIDGPPTWKRSKGTPYVVLSCGGPQEEGMVAPRGLSSSEKGGWRRYQVELENYLASKKPKKKTIEWRTRPEIDSFDTLFIRGKPVRQKRPVWKVYSRLAVY